MLGADFLTSYKYIIWTSCFNAEYFYSLFQVLCDESENNIQLVLCLVLELFVFAMFKWKKIQDLLNDHVKSHDSCILYLFAMFYCHYTRWNIF